MSDAMYKYSTKEIPKALTLMVHRKTSNRRVQRSEADLINALEQHLDLLGDSIQKLRAGDLKYFKSIAAELRVLVYKGASNKPLLLHLAKINNIVPIIKRDVPPLKRPELPLQDFLNELFFSSGTLNVSLTNAQLIAKVSQQEGSAHEDLKHEFDYIAAKGDGILIKGQKPYLLGILGIAECIYFTGINVLKLLKEEGGEK